MTSLIVDGVPFRRAWKSRRDKFHASTSDESDPGFENAVDVIESE
jgi:hypothetical protein